MLFRSRGVASGKPLRLIAPYERNTTKWFDLEYMDTNSPGNKHRITVDPTPGSESGSSDAPVRVMTWCDVIEEFDAHPEVKGCDADGRTCSVETRGILRRHHLRIGRVEYIGKESNRLSDQDEPLPDLAPYEIPVYGSLRDDVRELVLPVLHAHGFTSRQSDDSSHGISRRKLSDALGPAEKGGRESAIKRYLGRDNLSTDINRVDVRRLRDDIIRLAVRLAVDDLKSQPGFPVEWRVKAVQNDSAWEILVFWRDGRN